MTQRLGAGQTSSSQMGHHRLSQGLGERRKCQSWLLLTLWECALKEDPVSAQFGLLLPGDSLKMQCTSTTEGWVGDLFLFKTVTRTGPYSSWLDKTEKGGYLKGKWEINVVPFCPGAALGHLGGESNPVSRRVQGEGNKTGACTAIEFYPFFIKIMTFPAQSSQTEEERP